MCSILFLHYIVTLALHLTLVLIGLYLLFFIVNKITPLRVSEEKEALGLDISQHGEFL